MRVTLARLVKDAGLLGGFDDASANHGVSPALVVTQGCAGLKMWRYVWFHGLCHRELFWNDGGRQLAQTDPWFNDVAKRFVEASDALVATTNLKVYLDASTIE